MDILAQARAAMREMEEDCAAVAAHAAAIAAIAATAGVPALDRRVDLTANAARLCTAAELAATVAGIPADASPKPVLSRRLTRFDLHAEIARTQRDASDRRRAELEWAHLAAMNGDPVESTASIVIGDTLHASVETAAWYARFLEDRERA